MTTGDLAWRCGRDIRWIEKVEAGTLRSSAFNARLLGMNLGILTVEALPGELLVVGGTVARVSPEDWRWAREWQWFRNASGYVCRAEFGACGPREVYLHREVMARALKKAPPGTQVHHLAGRFDNRPGCLALIDRQEHKKIHGRNP